MRDYRMIDSGSTVYGSDGRKIGAVKDCTQNWCHIDTGFLGLGPDYYVPMENIRDVRAGEVFLDVPSDRINQMGWEREPAGRPQAEPTRRAGVTEERRAGMAEEPRAEEHARGIPLEEEQLRVTKHREQAGEVEIGREVHEEQREFTVPVSHEEVVVTRHDVEGPAEPGRAIGEGETIRVPLSEERVEVTKEPHVYGEVDVEKREVTEQRHVGGTVRKEYPEIRKRGDVEDKIEDETTREERRREEYRERPEEPKR